MSDFVSRAGQKLEFGLSQFGVDINGKVCADLGSNTGGFVDCLLRRGAAKVYAIDTGYGALDWKLRKDPRVVVMERTNAMHATLPEKPSIVTIDVAWTKQRHILPAARKMIVDGGDCVTLIKPHYEAEAGMLKGGVLAEEMVESVVDSAMAEVQSLGWEIICSVKSPIKGSKGNVEVLAHLKPV